MRLRNAAGEQDLEAIVSWRAEAAEWLARLGSDQWSGAGLDGEEFRRRVRASIHAGQTWMADGGGVPVGTIAIDEHADPGLWSEAELADAVLVHRMIVPRCAAGRGIGALLLAHAERIAHQQGRGYLRLDAWTTNTRLHHYYRRAGFRHVRTNTAHRSPSAALFERPVPPRGP